MTAHQARPAHDGPANEAAADGLLAAVAALPVMLLGFDGDGTCTLAEGALTARFRTDTHELVGMRLTELFARCPQQAEAVRRCLLGEALFTHGSGDGSLSVDIQWHPQRDAQGLVVGVLGLATETADHDDASSVIRAEQEYRALLRAVPDQVFRLGIGMQAVMVKPVSDPTAEQLPVTWRPAPLAHLATWEASSTLTDAVAEVLASGTQQLVEERVQEASGVRCFEIRLIPETDEQVLCIVRDVTSLRQAEVERREASKLEALGRLSAGVAHEINTPIQFVSHNVEFMSQAFAAMHQLLLAYRQALHGDVSLPWPERSARLLEQEQLHDVDFLLDEVPQAVEETLGGIRRVGTIVHAMKQFSHPSAADLSASDVNDALHNAVVVSTNEHKLVADVETRLGELPSVICSPGELTQVFLNLIVNAAHALEPLVSERGRRGRIEVTSELVGDEVVVRVRDDGPGISYEDQERIFDAFFTTKEVGHGTGQGLTLARSIVVDRHGGELTLHSVPGEGATFEVRLPLAGPSLAERLEDVAGGAA